MLLSVTPQFPGNLQDGPEGPRLCAEARAHRGGWTEPTGPERGTWGPTRLEPAVGSVDCADGPRVIHKGAQSPLRGVPLAWPWFSPNHLLDSNYSAKLRPCPHGRLKACLGRGARSTGRRGSSLRNRCRGSPRLPGTHGHIRVTGPRRAGPASSLSLWQSAPGKQSPRFRGKPTRDLSGPLAAASTSC